MVVRTSETTVTFTRSFSLGAMDRPQPVGTYRIVMDDDEVPGVSFVALRRIATFLHTGAIDLRADKIRGVPRRRERIGGGARRRWPRRSAGHVMNVRIPGNGVNLSPGACRSISRILFLYAKATAKPCNSILASVFGSNDIRAGHARPRPRFLVVSGPMQFGEPAP
jgi:hypothetical protein